MNYASHSVRLDDEVWEKVRAMPESLNQFLRRELLGQLITPAVEKRIARQVKPRPRQSDYVDLSVQRPGDMAQPRALVMTKVEGMKTVLAVQHEYNAAVAQAQGLKEWRRGPRPKGDKTR